MFWKYIELNHRRRSYQEYQSGTAEPSPRYVPNGRRHDGYVNGVGWPNLSGEPGGYRPIVPYKVTVATPTNSAWLKFGDWLSSWASPGPIASSADQTPGSRTPAGSVATNRPLSKVQSAFILHI